MWGSNENNNHCIPENWLACRPISEQIRTAKIKRKIKLDHMQIHVIHTNI